MTQNQTASTWELNKAVPFPLHVDDDLLAITKQKLGLARLPEELTDIADDDWSQGAKVKIVKRLAAYWRDNFDWRAEEARINKEFNSFKVKVNIEGYGHQIIHFAHQRSSRDNAIPLLISHGWPGSFLESRKVIGALTEPALANTQAFHLVIPSIPGYGPGDPPTKSGFGPTFTAEAFVRLMVDVLRYERFVTQGGDWGSMITRVMCMQYPRHVCACHYTMIPVGPPPIYKNPIAMGRLVLSSFTYSTMEKNSLARFMQYEKEMNGYLKVQSTRPQSLGFGLGDSPIGLLGWLVEKYHEWMDVNNYDMPDNEVLAFVMMHWMQGATPGLRYYKAVFSEPKISHGRFTGYAYQPCGVSVFPKELFTPPRDWVNPVMNVQFWKEHEKGGHFASVECPDEFVQDLQNFFGSKVVKSAFAE